MSCQLLTIDGIGEKNSFLTDRLQYLIRKYRYYRKRIVVRLRSERTYSSTPVTEPGEIKPGDMVRVLSKDEIRHTLDRRGKVGGCSFLQNQYDFCGQEFRVFKRVDFFFDETRQKMLRSKNLFYLEGAYCDGRSAYLKPCDRHCFHYWHRNWLERA